MPAGSLWVILGLAGIATVSGIYPLLLLLCPRTARPIPVNSTSGYPSVTIITAARNAAALLEAKLRNMAQMDYPSDRLAFIVASDASTDGTRDLVLKCNDPRLRLVEQSEHAGKAAALNRAVAETDTDLLLFSDADALLAPDAVLKMARHFADADVGGVCGQRMIASGGRPFRDAQQTYINLDSRLKCIESAHGRITSNDGKIHMVRRSLFRPIPGDVTDDLYTALAVIAQGYRFVFEPDAVAVIGVPSRHLRHEIRRRRRIVTRSLTGIFRMRRLLNPFRHGLFSIGLLINKVGRRFLPFFLVSLMAGGARIGVEYWAPVTVGALAAALLAGTAALLRVDLPERGRRWMKPLRAAQYALAGFIGTAWGVLDFLTGRRVCVWEPLKTPASAKS